MTTVTRNDKARGGRTYTIDGNEYPSVTTVLQVIAKPALIPWAKKVSLEKVRAELYTYVDDSLFGGQRTLDRRGVDTIVESARKRPDEVRDEAADFGSQAHGLVEGHILWAMGKREALPIVPPALAPVVNTFFAWQEQAGLTIPHSARVGYSTAHGFVGTLDGLATRNGLPVVLDWKTSNGLWPEMRLQVAAYALALSEMDGRTLDEAWIVRFNKDVPKHPEDAFEAVKIDGKALADAQAAFLNALWLWRWMHPTTAPEKVAVNGKE